MRLAIHTIFNILILIISSIALSCSRANAENDFDKSLKLYNSIAKRANHYEATDYYAWGRALDSAEIYLSRINSPRHSLEYLGFRIRYYFALGKVREVDSILSISEKLKITVDKNNTQYLNYIISESFYRSYRIEYKKQIHELSDCIPIAKKIKNCDYQILLFNELAKAQINIKNTKEAEKYLNEALEKPCSIDNKNISETYRLLGNIYTLKDSALAEKYYTSSLKFANLHKDTFQISLTLWSYSDLYLQNNNYEKFLELLDMGIEQSEKRGYIGLQSGMLTLKGHYYTKIGDNEASLNYNYKARLLRTKYGIMGSIASSSINIATVYIKMKNYESAKDYLLSGLNLAVQSNDNRFVTRAYKLLAGVEENLGNLENALRYYKEYLIRELNIQKAINDKDIIAIEMIHEVELQNQKNRMLKQNNKLERTFFLILASVMILLILFIIHKARTKLRSKHELENLVRERTKEIIEANKNLKEQIDIRQETEDKFRELNQELEIKIFERTHELEEATAQLELALTEEKELNALKSSFITMVSHEFRTPMTIILSSVGIIQSNLLSNKTERIPDHIAKIEKSINSMIRLIEEALTYSKLESGSYKPTYSVVNLDYLIENLAKDFLKKINFSHEIDIISNGNSQSVTTDSYIIKQIIMQLLDNASKYSPIHTKIEIIYGASELGMTITIKDNGAGFSENSKKYLFMPFYKSEKDLAIKSGIGIGLAIVHKYVELLNGMIELESQVGEGSKFIVSLPINK